MLKGHGTPIVGNLRDMDIKLSNSNILNMSAAPFLRIYFDQPCAITSQILIKIRFKVIM